MLQMNRSVVLMGFAAMLLATLGGVIVELRRASRITVTVSPQQPVYTVGPAAEAIDLLAGTQLTRYGPLFWGIYPGAIAFRTPGEAVTYLAQSNLNLAQWQVFRLSGEYGLDVQDARIPNRINKSLAMVERVRLGHPQPAPLTP